MGISNSFAVGRTLRVPPIKFIALRIIDILFVIHVLATFSTYRGCGAVVGQSGVAGTATAGNTIVSTGTHNGAENDAIRTLTRVVHTRYGKMQGVVKTAAVRYTSKKVDVFLGVPYATPPTGANRFSPTRALTPWDGVRVFDEFGAVCPQWLPDIANETAALERMPKGRLQHLKRLLPFLRNQSEDCLYLNIYAPSSGNKFESEAKYPVIVFFHGESFSWNAGNPYDGHILASYTDSIVVTFNYRLGVLGFLNVNAEPYQKARVANYGLMDQIAALDWIRQNIGHFDGDAKNITLLGHGTGAACINFLMVSPAAMPGLFHRVILLSGSALSSWALIEEPIVYSLEIARQMNCTTDDADNIRNYEHIVDCLREVPLTTLMNAKIVAPTFLNAFGPNVDGVVIKTNFQEEIAANVLPDMQTYGAKVSGTNGQHRSSKIARESKSANAINANKYDLLFGCVTAEALRRFSHEDLQSGFEGDRRDRILRTYIRNTYNYHLSEIFFTVVNEYTDWERTVLHPINTRDSTVAALSDAQFVAPLVQMGDLFGRSPASLHPSSNGNSMIPRSTKAFFYVFDYQTKDGDYSSRMGTAHGEDLPYIFGAPLTDSLSHFPNNFTKPEVTLSEALMIYIGNFARTGDPNDYQKQDSALPVSKERNRFRTAVWEEYDPVHQKYLEISMKPKMKNHFRAHQLSVWLRLIPELHRAGMEDVTLRHNTFHTAHDSNNIYDGILRNDRYGVSSNTRRSYVSSHGNGTAAEVVQSITTVEPYLTTCVNAPAVEKTAGVADRTNLTYAVVAATNEPYNLATYSTTLSLTIAIGCTLLVLNVLIFAGVYYQRDKTRMEIKTLREQQRRQQVNGGGGGDSGAGDSPYGVKSVPRGGYQSAGSIMLDLEPTVTMTGDGGSILYNSVAGTIPRAASGGDHHVYKYHSAALQATLPRHLQSSKSTHITRNDVGGGGSNGLRSGDDMTMYIDCKTPIVFEEPYPGASANGSIVMHPVSSSVLPKPPPPPKSSSPLQSQPLLHGGSSGGGGGGHTSTTTHQKCGILKVPTAAMNEMRV